MLMQTKRLTQEASGAAPHNGVADLATGNHSQTRMGILRQPAPIGDEATLDQTLAFLAKPREVTALLDLHRAPQAQPLWHSCPHAPSWLDRCQTLATRPTAIAQNGAPAFA